MDSRCLNILVADVPQLNASESVDARVVPPIVFIIARGVRSLEAGIVGDIEQILNPGRVAIFIGERPSAWALAGGSHIIAAVLSHTLLSARVAARTRTRVGPVAAH